MAFVEGQLNSGQICVDYGGNQHLELRVEQLRLALERFDLNLMRLWSYHMVDKSHKLYDVLEIICSDISVHMSSVHRRVLSFP